MTPSLGDTNVDALKRQHPITYYYLRGFKYITTSHFVNTLKW